MGELQLGAHRMINQVVYIIFIGSSAICSLGDSLSQLKVDFGDEIHKSVITSDQKFDEDGERIRRLEYNFQQKIRQLEDNFQQKIRQLEDNFQQKIQQLEDQIIQVKTDGWYGAVKNLTTIEEDMAENIKILETKVKKTAVCGYRIGWYKNDAVITYDSVVAQVNEFSDVSSLDKGSGIFNAPVTGLYEVSAAGRCRLFGDSLQRVELMSNNTEIDYDFLYQYKEDQSRMSTPRSGFRYVPLEEGDNLYLKYTMRGETGDASIEGLKFCVALLN